MNKLLMLPILCCLAAALAAPPEPRTRSFHMEYRATIKEAPAGAKRIDLWRRFRKPIRISRSRICASKVQPATRQQLSMATRWFTFPRRKARWRSN